MQIIVFINNSRTASSTSILMLFLSSLDNLLYCIRHFSKRPKKGVDKFEIEHKTCYFLVRGVVPPYCPQHGTTPQIRTHIDDLEMTYPRNKRYHGSV